MHSAGIGSSIIGDQAACQVGGVEEKIGTTATELEASSGEESTKNLISTTLRYEVQELTTADERWIRGFLATSVSRW